MSEYYHRLAQKCIEKIKIVDEKINELYKENNDITIINNADLLFENEKSQNKLKQSFDNNFKLASASLELNKEHSRQLIYLSILLIRLWDNAESANLLIKRFEKYVFQFYSCITRSSLIYYYQEHVPIKWNGFKFYKYDGLWKIEKALNEDPFDVKFIEKSKQYSISVPNPNPFTFYPGSNYEFGRFGQSGDYKKRKQDYKLKRRRR